MNDSESNLSFVHLQLELARLDIMLHRQIKRFQQAATPSDDSVGSSYFMSGNQVLSLLQRPFGSSYPDLDDEENLPYDEALNRIQGEIASLVEQAQTDQIPLRLFQIATYLELDRLSLDTFLISIAPQLDKRYGKIYGFLLDDLTRKRPSVNLILDLLCVNKPDRLLALSLFSNDAPLIRHRLVTLEAEPNNYQPPLIDKSIFPDEGIVNWLLLGHYQPPERLKKQLFFNPAPHANINLVPNSPQSRLSSLANVGEFFNLYGLDHLSKNEAATFIAQSAGQCLLTLDLGKVNREETPFAEALQILLRDALLMNALPAVAGWDACLTENVPPAHLLNMLISHSGPVVIMSKTRWQPRGAPRSRHFYWFKFALPTTAERTRLLTHFLSEEASVSESDVALLTGQFKLTTEQLQDLVSTARDIAMQNGRSLESQDLFAAARAHSNPRLATLARKITPRYSWTDLILPEDQIQLLQEMVNTIRSRPIVLEKWGVGKKLAASAGVTGLFFGPPGTGKTMAAEVIAGELHLDLYKIDLSSMVSKYIGETEKNLEKIFTEAESSNAILFFDEADAIFGKRSEVKDAHDRYANIEISYLLQRMEMYNGVTILATNLRANLDDAFMRRIQFALSFPDPRAADRLRIWKALLPEDVPKSDNLDLEYMAEQFEIPGGNIRNIIVGAAYLAASNGQVLDMEHLLHSTRRELQKMGRLVNERDLVIK